MGAFFMDLYNIGQSQGVANHAGFPNPATDTNIIALDMASLLVKHPSSTFFMQLSGNAWESSGVYDGDVAIVDRALEAKPGDLVIWWDGEEFAVSHFSKLPQGKQAWGVITSIIHRYRT
jgi:SOS-response transcriptional repressor LexA